MKKNIVIVVSGLLMLTFGAQAQEVTEAKKEVVKKERRLLWGLIKINPQPQGEIARQKVTRSYTTETRLYVRSDLDSQWGFPASKLPPKARKSETRLDLGRFQYERVVDSSHSHSIVGHDFTTGKTYHEATAHSSTNVYVVRQPAYRIPYSQLPDRGSSLSMPKGYQQTIIGAVPLKPLIAGPLIMVR